jgi:hypothetical protein
VNRKKKTRRQSVPSEVAGKIGTVPYTQRRETAFKGGSGLFLVFRATEQLKHFERTMFF